MADDAIAQFTSITDETPERAAQYLRLTENNVEQALQLYYDPGGAELVNALPPESTHESARTNDPPPSINPTTGDEDVEDDEAMARRLQNEMYGSTGGGPKQDTIDPETGVRAPMARTAETLAGPGADWQNDPDEMRAAIAEQMMMRRQRREQGKSKLMSLWNFVQQCSRLYSGRAGIFNQQGDDSSTAVWDEEDSQTRRQHLSRATGGASESSSKSNMLAELYRPPFELISPRRTWEGVRAEGKEEEKWILINIQDPNIFDCQILNRDIWKDEQIQATVRESFVFKQYTKTDQQAAEYIRFYFQSVDSEDAYPHIAIVDPRTGERVKVWSGTPAPKAGDFLMQLHEFLDRYSLKADAKNPIAKRKREERKSKEVDKMTEDEMMQMAMQQSMTAERKGSGPKEDDPDDLTKSQNWGEASATNGHSVPASASKDAETPFAGISAASPHTEPDAQAPDQTRIQFRHPGGRVIRRFLLQEPVVRIFEWLKAEPLSPEMSGKEFQLVAMGRNLLDAVEQGETVEAAGLKNGTVMVEFSA